MNCKAHTDRVATDFCLDCQVPLCVGCVRHLAGGAYCAACYTGRYRKRSLVRNVVVLAVLACAGAGAYLLFEAKKRENRERERYGPHREQVEALRASFEEDLCDAGTALELALVLEATKNLGEAREALDRVVASCPPNAHVLLRLASVDRQLGRSAEALAVAEALIRHEPERAPGYALRGELREQTGLVDEALDDYRQAFELDPSQSETADRLALLLLRRGESCRSAEILDELLGRGNPPDPARFRERSDRLRKAGRCPRERIVGDRVIVPYEQRSDVMVVTVLLNGKTSARMLFDTGASSVALTPELANRLEIDTGDAETFLVATAGGVTRAHRVLLDSVSLGGASVEMVRAAVVDALVLDDAEGLLGNSFLSRFDVTVDAQAARVILEPRRGGQPQ